MRFFGIGLLVVFVQAIQDFPVQLLGFGLITDTGHGSTQYQSEVVIPFLPIPSFYVTHDVGIRRHISVIVQNRVHVAALNRLSRCCEQGIDSRLLQPLQQQPIGKGPQGRVRNPSGLVNLKQIGTTSVHAGERQRTGAVVRISAVVDTVVVQGFCVHRRHGWVLCYLIAFHVTQFQQVSPVFVVCHHNFHMRIKRFPDIAFLGLHRIAMEQFSQ